MGVIVYLFQDCVRDRSCLTIYEIPYKKIKARLETQVTVIRYINNGKKKIWSILSRLKLNVHTK